MTRRGLIRSAGAGIILAATPSIVRATALPTDDTIVGYAVYRNDELAVSPNLVAYLERTWFAGMEVLKYRALEEITHNVHDAPLAIGGEHAAEEAQRS